jgi:hypothetical protein
MALITHFGFTLSFLDRSAKSKIDRTAKDQKSKLTPASDVACSVVYSLQPVDGCYDPDHDQDLGSFPLFWIIPLALYLLTFVLAFAKRL